MILLQYNTVGLLKQICMAYNLSEPTDRSSLKGMFEFSHFTGAVHNVQVVCRHSYNTQHPELEECVPQASTKFLQMDYQVPGSNASPNEETHCYFWILLSRHEVFI